MMKIFVTGHHRAGTHALAMELAKKNGILYFAEERIRWDHFESAQKIAQGYSPKWEPVDGKWTVKYYRDPMIDSGFVLQCPGLAHKTVQLSDIGKVYWCVRPRIKLITAMKNAGISLQAWHIMKQFNSEFPDDPIWPKLSYDGSEDVHDGFVRYLNLLSQVKEHFFNTKFKDLCEVRILEDQEYYNAGTDLSLIKPLKNREARAIL